MDLAAKLKQKFGAGMTNLGKGIQNDLYNGYFKSRPSSVIGNVVLGKPWNQNIPDMGGMVSPLQSYTPQKISRAIVPQAQAAAPQPTKAPTQVKQQSKKQVVAAATPTLTPSPDALEKTLQKGLQAYSPHAPIATMAATLAQAGRQMPQGNKINQYLPALIAMIETSGGKNMTRGNDNIYNMNANSGGTDYPDLQTAILGGGEHKGLVGTLQNPAYNDFRKSGKLQDLLNHFTPPNDNNASMDRQMYRYNDLYKTYFDPNQQQ